MKQEAMEPTKREIWEMLALGKNYRDETIALRKRLKDAEGQMRLTEASMTTPAGGSRSVEFTAPMEAMMRDYKKQCQRIHHRLEVMQKRRETLEILLAALPEMERRVITMRWIEGKSWKEVAYRIFTCERNGQRIQKRGIERMAAMLVALTRDQKDV